ncbi:single-stranded-DNA-specific exonuclease RecJ [Endozoicomonas sp. OPT23]|uniref:single-stranded-DNA-specific exonuclease RecJ n=1 Tax=Endozoicomonas sp. OPT23 TaxID=2072845 RepID=UPI00129B8EBE|nr:single-stranded-DNA-specific exonuclease RecJ [Endozoicomonas sp. OPT23]MRI35038.1 single-stranded-DNA-specific exonuclease RecJ [Endozoicomonas sp. OPT23]
MSTRILRRPVNPEYLQQLPEFHPLLARIYSGRGVSHSEEISRQLKGLHSYHSLKDIDKAASVLADAVTSNKQILIVGDFDCDGATSSALGVLALRGMGGRADYLVPNRFEYGYGLTPEIVEVAEQYQPEVLVTVDNGISSIEGVAAAKSRGWQVVVTDHHLAGRETPVADAIVNPNQHGCPFTGKNTAGVGIIFYVMCALRTELKNRGWFENHQAFNPFNLLDLVALGTIADVVSLDANNRILAWQGLARIKAGHCRPGIQALIEISNRNQQQLTSTDLGFALGPRLNAAGRLDDMSTGIELLLTNNLDQARELASELDGLNRDRKEIESGMQQEALKLLATLELDKEKEQPWGVSLFQEGWHQGVIGILASRIKEKLNRPVIAFADADNDELKGSARSIKGLHMRDALDSVARENPGVILKFGGHAMAAGLSIKKQDFERFQQAFDREVRNQLKPEQLEAELHTDGELKVSDLSMDTAALLRDAGPWGQNFPEPTFDGTFQVLQQRLVGQKHLKLVLKVPSSEFYLDAIAFNIDTAVWPDLSIQKIHTVYKLDINEFRGQHSLQLMIDYLEPA